MRQKAAQFGGFSIFGMNPSFFGIDRVVLGETSNGADQMSKKA